MTAQHVGARALRVAAMAAAVVAGAWTGAAGLPAREPTSPRRHPPVAHTVTIEGSRFQPAALDVRPGDTVVWKNADMFPHTATAKAAGFDSGAIEPGESWRLTVPQQRGDLPYVCAYHPTMTGVVRVR